MKEPTLVIKKEQREDTIKQQKGTVVFFEQRPTKTELMNSFPEIGKKRIEALLDLDYMEVKVMDSAIILTYTIVQPEHGDKLDITT